MTREEVKTLLAALKAAYPHFYAKHSGAELKAAVDIWAVALAEYPSEHIMGGVKTLVQQCRYPPTVAEVIGAAKQSAPNLLHQLSGAAAAYREQNPNWAKDGGKVCAIEQGVAGCLPKANRAGCARPLQKAQRTGSSRSEEDELVRPPEKAQRTGCLPKANRRN